MRLWQKSKGCSSKWWWKWTSSSMICKHLAGGIGTRNLTLKFLRRELKNLTFGAQNLSLKSRQRKSHPYLLRVRIKNLNLVWAFSGLIPTNLSAWFSVRTIKKRRKTLLQKFTQYIQEIVLRAIWVIECQHGWQRLPSLRNPYKKSTQLRVTYLWQCSHQKWISKKWSHSEVEVLR